ncbi:MAG: metal-dependent transcriptional regulator [Fimbriimonadaceae bacterium]
MAPNNRLTPRLESYLVTIADLCQREGEARIGDIAKTSGVTMASVSEAVSSLSKKGMLEHNAWGVVTLTDEGLAEAYRITQRLETISRFFHYILGLPEELATVQAAAAQAYVADGTLRELENFTDSVVNCKAKKSECPCSMHAAAAVCRGRVQLPQVRSDDKTVN